MGGLSKKAYQLEKIRGLYSTPYLTVDGGNLLFKRESLPPALLQQSAITAKGITEAYNLMGYDAVAIGRNDLAAGLTFLKENASHSQFKWLSANLVSISDRKPIFQASLKLKFSNLTVGIIGLTGQVGKDLFLDKEDATILPWQEVLPELVAELSAECDILILLSNNSLKTNHEIANSLENIHLIIQSSPAARNTTPVLTHKSLIAQTGKQGKYLGWMLIDWQKSGIWGRKGAIKELTLKKQELDGINGRISRIERREKNTDLSKNSSYQNLLQLRGIMLAKVALLEKEQDKLRNREYIPSTYENSFITLEPKFPDHAEVERIVQKTKENVNLAGRKSALKTAEISEQNTISRIKKVFSGWQTCAKCHAEQTDFWQKTNHSSAYRTLVKREQQFNLDCLSCHVTSEYKNTRVSDNESVLLSLPAELQTVGCEICHGPGIAHTESQNPGQISRRPKPEICLRCHTPEQDENFDYENDLVRFACPQDGKK